MTRKPAAFTAIVMSLALVLGACDSDNPTAPSQGPAPPPSSGTPTTWNITVTIDPPSVDLEQILGGATTATVRVVASRASDGQPPPVGSTTVVSTSAGTLVNESGTVGTSVPVAFGSGGRAVATLNLPTAAGTIVVQAQIEQSSGQASIQVLEGALGEALFIEDVVPDTGPPDGGTQVRILGSGFDPPVRVQFGGLNADVMSVSNDVIRVLSPAVSLPVGQVSTVSVTVTINVNDPEDPEASDTLPGAFTYARAGQARSPSIISISPTSGPNEGGTQVTILGEGFADRVQVFFGTSALIEAPVLDISPSQLIVETPSATGPNAVNQNSIVNVRVVNTDSGLFSELPSAYQYGSPAGPFISAAGPTEGIYLGGTTVEVFGQGFDEPVALEFGGLGQQEISVTGTEIVGRSVAVEIVNCNRPSGPFRVTNIETGEQTPDGPIFTYRPVEPVILALDPPETTVDLQTREITGPTTTTISGGGFDFPVRVTFGDDNAASVVPGSIVLDPAFDPRYEIASAFDVEIPRFLDDFETGDCVDAFGNQGEVFLPTQVDVMVVNLPTDCDDTFTKGFIYVPSDQSCRVEGDPPEAAFSFSGVAGSFTVSFIDESTNDPTEWLWDFGDGTTSTEQNPSHLYTVGPQRIYTVTLTATNAFGSDTTSQFVDVPIPSPPVASFTFSQPGGSGSFLVEFMDTSSGDPTAWSWDFGDGTTSASQNPTHDYTAAGAGTYQVTLTVTNALGSSTSDPRDVTVPVP